MRRKPFFHQPEWRLFAAVTVLAVALTVWHQRARAASRVSPPEQAVRATLSPLQYATTAVYDESALLVGSTGRARALARQNDLLRRQLAEKEAELTERQREHIDYLRILRVLGFDEPLPPDHIPARVVGRSGGRILRQTIDIEAARGRELREGDVVCAEFGLVGRVIHAQGSRGEATILLDPNSGVAAVVYPSSSLGSVLGPDLASPEPDLLRLVRLDRNAAISQGDKVFTGKIGETYPPGIPIGEVEEVIGGLAPGEGKTALVRPYADFEHLDYVVIVRPSA